MLYKQLGIENADSFVPLYREYDSVRPGLEPGIWVLFLFGFFNSLGAPDTTFWELLG